MTEAIQQPGRRRAVVWGLRALAAALLAAYGGVTALFLGNSLRRRAASRWVSAGELATLPAAGFQRRVLAVRSRDAWVERELQRTAWVGRRADGSPVAFLAACSHMGCQVSWSAERGKFLCPCHAGEFGPDGAVVAGPPARGLTPLPCRVENERVLVELS